MSKYHFFSNCVSWPEYDIEGLDEVVDQSVSITRRTFLRHVDREEQAELERELGYDRHLLMKNDWAVSYFRSTLHGERVYGFCWSSIEYVFVQNIDGMFEKIRRKRNEIQSKKCFSAS